MRFLKPRLIQNTVSFSWASGRTKKEASLISFVLADGIVLCSNFQFGTKIFSTRFDKREQFDIFAPN